MDTFDFFCKCRKRWSKISRTSQRATNDIYLLTGLVAKDLSHGHDRCQFKGLEQGCGRKRYILQGFVLTPTAQHVGYGRERIFVNDRRLTSTRFQIQQQKSRHDQRPKAAGKDQSVRVGKVFSSVAWVTSCQHSFLPRKKKKRKSILVAEDMRKNSENTGKL